MPKRYWLPYAASLGIVLAGHTQAEAAYHRSAHHRAAHTSPPPAIEAGSPLQGDLERMAGALEAANAQTRAAQDAADKSQKDMAAIADRMATVASVEAGMIFIGVLLVGFTLAAARRAAKAAEESVKETRRTGEAQTRAYLHPGEATFTLGEDSFSASMILMNTGRSPGTNIVIAGTLSIYNTDQLLASIDFDSKSTPPITAETEGTAFFDVAKLPEFDLVKNLRIRIRCDVSWEDVFGKRQNLPLSLLTADLGELRRGEDAKAYRNGRLIVVNRISGKDNGSA